MYFEISIRNISDKKIRSLLTLLGVIIGISAIVTMVSIGEGLKKSVKEQLESIGADKIFVVPKFAYGAVTTPLTDDIVKDIEKVEGVKAVSPLYSIRTKVEYRNEVKLTTVYGIEPEKSKITFGDVGGYRILYGRWLKKGDRYNAVIGYGIYKDHFSRKVGLNSKIKIKNREFTVVGIFTKTGDRSKDYVVYTNLDVIRELTNAKKEISLVVVRVKEGYDVEKVRIKIKSSIKKKNKNVVVLTQKQILKNVEEAYKIVNTVFGGLAGVSLLVGAIGIANTMLMNVLERKREIGIMKSVGATNSKIMKIFLFESAIYGFLGGLVGLTLGFIASKVINILANMYLGEGILKTSISPELALFALSFSTVIGVLSGVYPAYRASKLDPIEALRS